MSKRPLTDSMENMPSKKKKYVCKFNSAWIGEFKCVKRSEKGESFAYCTACNTHLNISSGGKNDLTRHLKSMQHIANEKSSHNVPKVTHMFAPTSADSVTKAEVLFANFVAEHNLPFLVADHFSELCKVMFPDSQIAQKFRCKRTKVTNIVNNALGPMYDNQVTLLCKENPFSVMMDESNDSGDEKCVAILVRVFDIDIHRVTTKFLAMPICNIGTGENLFNCLQEVLTKRQIPWSNLVGFSSDNANVMVGKKNSVLSRVREQQPNVIDLGCICHLASTCTQYGLKKLAVPVEELLVDTYHHFTYSSKHREVYKEFLEFTNTEEYKLVKHCSTRWLSLQKCIARFLQQWPALQSYFQNHEDAEKIGSRVNRSVENLKNPEMKLTYHFLLYIMERLNDFNTMFQAGDAMVGYLHVEMERILRKFMGKFVKTSVITASASITEVNFMSPENQHDNSLLAVGMEARRFVHNNSDDISLSQLSSFFRSVRSFNEEVTAMMLAKFPFNDQTLKALGYLNPERRLEISVEAVLQLSDRLVTATDKQCQLEDEFRDFQLSPASDLPSFTQGETPLDVFWVDMSRVSTPLKKPRFPNLVKLSMAALSLPHSNADPERCFSMLRKIQTDHRGNLCGKTVSSLLSCKINAKCDCYEFRPSNDLCVAAKGASLQD